MKQILILFTCLLYLAIGLTQSPDGTSYMSPSNPGLVPQVFAPGFISLPNEYEFGSVFSEDGTEFFYGVDVGDRNEIRYCQLENGAWTQPKVLNSDAVYSFNDPFLSPDEQELYFISDRPRREGDTTRDHNIWYLKRMGDSWSAPMDVGDAINTDAEEYYMSFTENGTLYFSSKKEAAEDESYNCDLYFSPRVNGAYQTATKLGPTVNTNRYEADVFVAPDESYLIFCSIRRNGMGKGDLYISFRQADGSWSEAVNMGAPVNTEGHELCPFVTMDGKYLFYTSKKDIYWVSTEILEQYKGGK